MNLRLIFMLNPDENLKTKKLVFIELQKIDLRAEKLKVNIFGLKRNVTD